MKRSANNTQAKIQDEQIGSLTDGSGREDSSSDRPMADIMSCDESLKLLKKVHRPSLSRVIELISKASD